MAGQRPDAHGPWPGGHDDHLFLSLAKHIADGHWLGPYSNLTLAKGPFYPMWIAGSFILGVPLQMSQNFLYITACVVTILALRPVVRSSAALVAMYGGVLLFNPVMFGITRVLREGVYIPLTLLLAACLIGLFVRRTRSWRTLALWAGGAGFALASMWLTREEAIWILPSVLFILSAAAFLEWRRGVQRLWQRCLLLFSPLAILGAALALVSGINLYSYGVFVVTEVAAGDWLAAYGALSRVEHDSPQRYMVVPGHVRERIYRVSPAFAELRPAIEGDLGRGWRSHGCRMMPETCGDITAGWFMGLLRDAVARAGHYHSAPVALGYYRRLAREVNAGCDAGTLRCGPPRATMMPPWRRDYGPLLLRSLAAGITDVVRFQAISVYSSASDGDEVALLPFRLMTRDRLAPSADAARLRVSGWGFSPDSDLLITVRDSRGAPVDVTQSHVTGRDVFDHFVSTEGRQFDRARDSRFILWTPCLRDCTLVIRAWPGPGARYAPTRWQRAVARHAEASISRRQPHGHESWQSRQVSRRRVQARNPERHRLALRPDRADSGGSPGHRCRRGADRVRLSGDIAGAACDAGRRVPLTHRADRVRRLDVVLEPNGTLPGPGPRLVLAGRTRGVPRNGEGLGCHAAKGECSD